MSDVFISYKREDQQRVGRLVQVLRDRGLSTWWDRDLAGGEGWREQTQAALQAARCVVVTWTEGSVGPAGDFVRDEAAQAKRRGVLVPVLLDRVDPPLGFGEVQGLDMVGWEGNAGDPRLADLCEAVRARVEGRVAPPPRAPMIRLARRVTFGSLGGAALVAALVVGANVFGAQDRLCAMPVIQPRLADACGTLGLGHQPTRDERVAWVARPPGSCPALREHIERFPLGTYRHQAADLLAARRVTPAVVWSPGKRNLPFVQLQDDRVHATEAAARAAALVLAQRKGETLCTSFAATTRFRLTSAQALAKQWACSRHAAGVSCGVEGEVICALEERADVEQESCGS